MEIEKVFIGFVAGVAFIVFAYIQYKRNEIYTWTGVEKKIDSPIYFYFMVSIWIFGAIYIFISLFNKLTAVGFEIIF